MEANTLGKTHQLKPRLSTYTSLPVIYTGFVILKTDVEIPELENFTWDFYFDAAWTRLKLHALESLL